jgi:hypothetical protein
LTDEVRRAALAAIASFELALYEVAAVYVVGAAMSRRGVAAAS